MIVHCTSCRAKFRIADEKIGPRGAKARCSRCETVFAVHRDLGAMPLAVDPRSAPPAGAPSEPPERAAVASRPRLRSTWISRVPSAPAPRLRIRSCSRRPPTARRPLFEEPIPSQRRPASPRARQTPSPGPCGRRPRASRSTRQTIRSSRARSPSRRATRAPIRSASRRRVPLGRTSTRPTRPLRRIRSLRPLRSQARRIRSPPRRRPARAGSAHRSLRPPRRRSRLARGGARRSPVPISRSRTAPRRRRSARQPRTRPPLGDMNAPEPIFGGGPALALEGPRSPSAHPTWISRRRLSPSSSGPARATPRTPPRR